MTADRIKELFPAALEGELSEEQSKQFEQALAEDPALAAEFKAYGRLVDRLSAVRRLEVPADFADRVMAQVRQLPVRQPGLLQRLGKLFSGGSRARRLPFELAAAAASIAIVVVAIRAYDAPQHKISPTVEAVKFSATPEGKAVPTDFSQFSRSDSERARVAEPALERDLRVASAPAPAPSAAPSAYRTISYGTVDDDLVRPDEPTLKRANNFFVLGRKAAMRAASRRSAPAGLAEEIAADEPSLPVAFEPAAREREEADILEDTAAGEVVAFRAKQQREFAAKSVPSGQRGAGIALGGSAAPAALAAPPPAPTPAPSAPVVIPAAVESAPMPAPQPEAPRTLPISEIFIHGTDAQAIVASEKVLQAIQYLKDNPSLRVGVGVYIARKTSGGGLILAPSSEHTAKVKELFAAHNVAHGQAHFSGLNASSALPGEPIGTIIIFKRF